MARYMYPCAVNYLSIYLTTSYAPIQDNFCKLTTSYHANEWAPDAVLPRYPSRPSQLAYEPLRPAVYEDKYKSKRESCYNLGQSRQND